MIKIVYGMPSAETMREFEAGRVLLGGCCIFDGAPLWACPQCGPRRAHLELDAETKLALADVATVLVDLIADRVRSPSMVARFLELHRAPMASSDEPALRSFVEPSFTAKTRD
jgi:hypothetical protein